MTLFIFGAGATRGCSFVKPAEAPCLPPLDNDFFTQLQRVQNPKHKKLISDVLRDVVEIFGVNFQVTLENVFTTLEHSLKMLEITGHVGRSRNYNRTELKEKRKRLVQSIAVVLEESLAVPRKAGGSTWKPRECTHSNKFVSCILKPGDSIISFNYDCVLDYALQKEGNEKWNPRYGYGFYLGSQGSKLIGDEHWSPARPAKKKETVTYYKLHGSLHFLMEDPEKETSKINLKKLPYTKTHGYKKFTIIPPEWHKGYSTGVFARLWSSAAASIYKARDIVVIGYSMPLSDLHSTALFRTSVKKGLKSLIVVNPEREARRRTREVFKTGIDVNTRVMSFDYLNEYLSYSQ